MPVRAGTLKEELTIGWTERVRGECWFISQLTSRVLLPNRTKAAVWYQGRAATMEVIGFYPANGNGDSHAFVPDPRGGTAVPVKRSMFVDPRKFDELEQQAREKQAVKQVQP